MCLWSERLTCGHVREERGQKSMNRAGYKDVWREREGERERKEIEREKARGRERERERK